MSRTILIPGWYYRNFDADMEREVPAEAYGGWRKASQLPFAVDHSALVVMHGWHCYEPGDFPGWEHAVEYLPRARKIMRRYFPELLRAARNAGLPVFHVAAGGRYYQELPEYRAVAAAAGEELPLPQAEADPVRRELDRFRFAEVSPGAHNQPDIERSRLARDFAPEARPEPGEAVVATARQLFLQCRKHEVNHLVYVGFALNWCLQMSPCCMIDMQRYGMLCSTIREATTAVENKESARLEVAKNMELWRVALQFGFVYDFADFTGALRGAAEQ